MSPRDEKLETIFRYKVLRGLIARRKISTERTIRKDNTIALDGRLYQIEERGGKKVVVEERLDGSLRMINEGVTLKYKEIAERPKKEVASKTDLRAHNRPWKPSWSS